MQGHLNLIVYEPHGLFFVLTPKCGSSSMVNVFLTMAGLDPRDGAIRALAWKARQDGTLAARGLHISQETTASVVEAAARWPGFRRIANIRNPYDRALSNYYNKLNRFTKRHARRTFLYGKLRQFLEGPRAWPGVNRGNAHMQARLPFEAMLRGLERHGIGFDAHYALQSDLLALDRLTYDHLFRLEDLDRTFRPAMEALGLPAPQLDRVGALPRNNRSANAGLDSPLMTPTAKEIIARLYARDFQALGYPV